MMQIDFQSWNKVINANNQDTILEQGEDAGMILPFSCRGGYCSACKVKLVSGQVKQLETEGLTDEEQQQDYILACSSIPLSDITVQRP